MMLENREGAVDFGCSLNEGKKGVTFIRISIIAAKTDNAG